LKPEDDPDLASTSIPAARRSTYPRRMGNAVRPLVDGEPAFRRICEAVESAKHSVWITVAFLERDVAMPDGRGTFFDVLDGAAVRGLDVRALFWREPRFDEFEPHSSHFPGDDAERRWLSERGSGLRARWDQLPDGFCQHQKSWIVDAGEATEVAFVGGINLDTASISAPSHPARAEPHVHDLYLELRGPAATDVHHNFVQRWNGASERNEAGGVWPDARAAGDLEFPAFLSAAAGDARVQITRTVMPRRYSDEASTPGGKPFPVADGETSVLEQYQAAIRAAHGSLYFENQAIGSPGIVDAIAGALERGVEVVFLIPGNAHPAFVKARKNPEAAFFFDALAALGTHANFTLAAIAGSRGEGRYDEIYVHAKILLIDDAWLTIGSTNIAERSFHNDTELNASVWHPPTVRALREKLLAEHLARDTSSVGDREAMRLYREVATANRDRRTRREPLEGLAYAIDPLHYGT
jgi:phosphatidylserine/phosphatidylglycerophosphate/cardiolipin synthase-like enzyme